LTDDLDLENRELCPDGGCIGVIGPDGRCSECGRTREQAASGADPEGAAGGDAPLDSDAPLGSIETSFDADRQLCPDGACIGVIGPDGRCKECGRSRDS
jgi:hypothetical protein